MIRKAKFLVETYHGLRAIFKLDVWALKASIARDLRATL